MKLFLRLLPLIAFLMGTMQSKAESNLVPVVFYLKNLPVDRIGTDSDQDIIADLESEGYFVVELDLAETDAIGSPGLEEYIMSFHESSPQYLQENYPDLQYDENNFFYLPEGYRIKRNIPVWNIEEHGADGSLDRVMRTYNEDIAPKFDLEPVNSPEEMKGPDGEPLDYNLYIDIIYPGGTPEVKVPVVMHYASSSDRHSSFKPSNIKRGIFPTGFLTSGYAWVNADHCYNPLARHTSYGYFDRYTLEDWNGLAAARAYIRYLRAHATEYNLNGKIGVMGISKASYSAVRTADINNAEKGEHFVFSGYEPNDKPQPWSEHSSTIDVAYAAAGNGTRRIPSYVDKNTVPMVTSAGRTDEYGHWDVYAEVVKHMRDMDLNHLELWMEDLGHTFPRIGTDYVTGENRYSLVKEFFDVYLKPDQTDKLKVFYAIPKEQATEVNNFGHSRYIPHNGLIPANMQGLSPYLPVTVRFLSEVDPATFDSHVSVLRKSDNVEVEGVWESQMGGTGFEFTPAEPLEPGESYSLQLTSGLADTEGLIMEEDFIREFVVSEVAPEITEHKITALEDTYTATSLNQVPRGDQDNLRLRYSPFGDWRFDVYVKFNIADLPDAELKGAKLRMYTTSALQGDPINMVLYKTVTDWSEDDLISSTKPAPGEQLGQTLFTGDKLYYEWDITSLITSAISNGDNEISVCLRVPSSEGTENIYFASKEHDDENLHPSLILETDDSDGSTNTPQIKSPDNRISYQLIGRKVTLHFTEGAFKNCKVFSITGQHIMSGSIYSNYHTIDFSSHKSGIYIVRLEGEGRPETIKIIVN